MGKLEYSLAFLALVAVTSAGPVGQRLQEGGATVCSNTCTGSSKFQYEVGSTYNYKYEVDTKTSVIGASEDNSVIDITAFANIEVISKCELVLKLSKATIFASDSKKFTNQDKDGEFAKGLERYPLRFSFQDGTIASVCAHDAELPWALNIKKGVLSSFQNTMMNLKVNHNDTESDIVGKCRTEYKVAQEGWKSITLKKSKDMSSCTQRNGFETSIQTVPFTVSSGFKSLEILKGTYECDQIINTQGYMTSSQCHEVQLFQPFSKESSGAATETTQKLTFIQKNRGITSQNAIGGKPQELYFDHDQEESKFNLSPRAALMLLRDMCITTMDDIKMDTPGDFSQLVYLMKRINVAGLKRIYNQANSPAFCSKNGERIKKFVTDALPMVGTAPAVELMKTLISNNKVKGAEADMWLASLTFIHNPSSDMIEQVLQLTGLPSLSSKVLLPLSTLVHTYCRINPDCEDVREVKEVIQLLERNIGGGCMADQQNFRKIMMSLRSLGNTGHADFAASALDKCVYNKDNSMDIRVAAVQAFRRLSCGADRNNLMALFRDPTEEAELRINAYLEVIRCPSPQVISQIKTALLAESFQQVGSFVWTHLTNLMESSDPDNKYIQQLLNDEVLEKEFDLEKLKFSRNYEASAFFERFNAGGKFDSNVIFSKESFVPRSASLNLTFNLFGESMNLFEVGGRVEGLEHLLESYFGTSGYFNNQDKSNNEVPQANPKLARLSASKLGDIRSKSKKMMDELRGAFYTRMLGNEMSYNMFGVNNGIDEEMPKPDMFEFLKKLRNNEKQDLSMTKSLMFLDSTYTVPTVAGLPLNLNVNGTSTVALNADGKIDMKKPGSKVVIEGMFEPSGAVKVDSMMSIDAFVTKGGMKMVSTLYTSTGAKAKMELTNGNVFDLTFDLTKDKSEILNVQTSFFMVHNEIEKEQKMIVADRYEKSACTGDRVLKSTGLLMCVGVSGPNATHRENAPNFPLTGPMSMSVSVEKKDLPNGYRMEAKTIKTPDQILFRFLSETPGSDTDRSIGLDVDVRQKQKTLDVNFISPWTKATMNGELTDKSHVKGLIATINIDDKRFYKLDAKILIDKTGDRKTYTPTITMEIPDWKNVYLTGVINYKTEESFDADLIITGALEDPITFQSTVQNTKTQVGFKTTLKWDKSEGYVFEAMSNRLTEKKRITTRHTYKPRVYVRTPDTEYMDMSGTVIFVEGKSLKVDGKIEKLLDYPITIAGNTLKTVYKKKREKYTGTVAVTAGKKNSKLTFLLDSRNWNFVSNKIKLEYNLGKGLKDTMIVKNKVKVNSKSNNVKVTSNVNSLRNNERDLSFAASFTRSRITSKLVSTLKYGKNYKKKDTKERLDFNFLTTYKMKNVKKIVNYTMELKLPAHKVDASITGGYIHDGKSLSNDVTISYHPQRSVSIALKLHNKTKDFPHYAGQIGFGLPEGREMFFAGSFGKESEDKYISNLEFEVIKGRKTKLDAMLKLATEKIYEVEVGVQLPDLDPVRVRGSYEKQKNGFKTDVSFNRGQKLYSMSAEALYKFGKNYKFNLDTKVPERRVKLIMASSVEKSERHNMLDIQWDADKNLDDRFLVNVTTDFKGWDDFEIASTLHYPTRTVNFNMKHSSGPRYITSAEISWSPKDKMEIKIIFRDDEYNKADRTELSVEFYSPFENYEELGLALSIIRDAKQYQTKSSVTWGKGKKVLVSASAKFPITVNRIDVAGTITTPFKSYRKMVANIKHRLSDDLDSSLLVDWGRERLVIKVQGKLENTQIKRSFTGDLEVRTPFEGLRIFLLHGEHKDDGRKFSSKIISDITVNSTQITSQKYMIEMGMTHDHTVAILDNKGTLEITIPNDYFSTVWELNSQLGRNHLLFDILPQRGNRFKVAFDETHQFKPHRKFQTTFEFLIPTEQIQELTAKFSHEDRINYLKTETMIKKDKVEIYSEKIFYERSQGHIQFDSEVKSAYSEDIVVKMTTSHSIMPYNVLISCQWAPSQIITVNTYLFYDKFGSYDASIDLTTPFQQAKEVKLTAKRERRGLNWEINTNLDYAPRQSISLSMAYRIDHVKFTSVSIRTPFPQFSNLDASFKLDGNLYKMDGEAQVTMIPYVNKIGTTFNWAYYKGTSLTGEFNLNTPFKQLPYMKAKVDSNMLGVSRVSNVEIEYMPTQIVKIESDYRFTSLDTLRGTLKVTSPYTENKQVVASFTHIGDKEEFTTDAKITCECFERAAFTKATFSSKDAITLTFTMDSPFRGYETVDLKFNHRGEIKDFHTHFEYETNGEKITLDNIFNIKNNVELQMKLLTPFKEMKRSHFELTHTGKFPNTRTLADLAFNDMEGHSDIKLDHDSKSTVLSADVTTPFKRYEKITGRVERHGDLNDLRAEGELKYDQLWKATYSHILSKTDMSASALLTSPLLEDDFIFEFNQTNKIDDFSSYTMYSMGPSYVSTSETKLKYDALPNLEFRILTDTIKDKEKKSNEITLLNVVRGTDYFFKFYTHVPKVLADMEMELQLHPEESAQMKYHVILELPHPKLASTVIVYSAESEMFGTTQKTKTEFMMETTMLEKIHVTQTQEIDTRGFQMKRTTLSKYGDQSASEVIYMDRNKFSVDYATTYDQYENVSLLIEYSGSLLENRPKVRHEIIEIDGKVNGLREYNGFRVPGQFKKPLTLSVVSTLTSSGLDGPIVATYNMKLDDEKEHRLRIDLPFDDIKRADAVLTYEFEDKFDFDLNIDSSAMDLPIKATGSLRPDSVVDFEMTVQLTSGFTNFTSMDLEVRNEKPKTAYRPYLKISWEDASKTAQVIEVDGSGKMVQQESGDMEVGAALIVKTPFEIMHDMNFNFDYEIVPSPMRLKESILAQYNNKKYLDMEAEFSALNKFSGIVDFRAPRPMTFSLSSENQGESVNGDLNLNWNKDDKDSFFRLQFGLSDTGDLSNMKKTFLVRVTRPERIVGIHNELERSTDKIVSRGKVSWDEKNKKEASYDMTYTMSKVKGGDLHNTAVKVIVPSRSIEVAGSFKGTKEEIVGTSIVLWDADKDKNKQVDVKLVLSPNKVKKTGGLYVSLPSVNKKLSLTTDLIVGEGRQLLDGQTVFSYSPKDDKNVLLEYFILEENPESNNYRFGWSLKHVDTRTLVEMKSVLKATSGIATGKMDFVYKKTDGSMETITLQGEANSNERKAFVKLLSADDSAELSGHVTNESPYVLTVSAQRKDDMTWKTVWSIDTTGNRLDASMTYGKDKKEISTKAYLPTAKSLVSETVSNTVKGTVQEGHLSADLEYRKLHGHLKWRPELVTDVMIFTSECMKEFISELSSALESGTSSAAVQVMGKWKRIRVSISQELSPIMAGVDDELKEVQKELRNVRRELKTMYKQNELYLKSIDEISEGIVKKMISSYSSAISRVGEVYKTMGERMEEMSNKIAEYPVKEKYNKMMDSVKASVEKTKEVMRSEVDIVFNTMKKNVKMVYAMYDKAMDDIYSTTRKYVSKLIDEIVLDPYLENLQEIYEEILTSSPVIQMSKEQIEKLLTQIQEILKTAMEENDWLEKYKLIFEKTQAILSEQLGVDEITNELLETVTELHDQVAIIYQYTETEMSLDLIYEVIEKVREHLMEEFNQLPLGLLDLHKSRFQTFDLDNGEIEFDLYLPIPMENFEKMMRFTVDKYKRRLIKMADKYFPRGDFVLSDFYYQFTPIQWSMKKDWVPPFNAYATVSGKDHYTTFDGRHLNIAGLCSYVLVTDVVDANFTIVQKYTGGPRKLARNSLVVMIHGITIEMFKDNTFKVDNQPRELPYITDHVEVVRTGSHVILTSVYGVEVISDFERDFHIIGLSGWYYGKVAGILGTYDNEPINDQGLPGGRVETDYRKFMNSWEVDEKCRSTRFYGTVRTPDKTETCGKVFDRTESSLRPCFLQVDPKSFQHSCDADPTSLCKVAALYSQVCSRNGIQVSLPTECMKCDDDKGSMYQPGETLKYERQQQNSPLQTSLDVVMIVEEKQCNRDVTDKLTGMVYELDESFNRAGSSNNRFSLLGYTRDSIYQHTMEGQIFNKASKFAMAIESLKLSPDKMAPSGDLTDPLQAIQTAISLPFRNGVSKVFVLISCMPCEEDGSYKYRLLSNDLEQRDITLHVMRNTGLHLKTNKSPKSPIYGIDKDQLFTGQSRRGEQNQHEEVHIPGDYCSNLAMSTNGSIFDSSHILSGSVRQQKEFLKTVGNRLGVNDDSAECQVCTCEVNGLGLPQSVCRKCDAQVLYFKPLPYMMSSVVNLKNSITNGLQKLF